MYMAFQFSLGVDLILLLPPPPLQVYNGLSTPPPIPRSHNGTTTTANNNNSVGHNTNKSSASNLTFSSQRIIARDRKELNCGGGGGHTGSHDPKEKWRRLEVSPEAIDCLQLVREGTYGRIYSGTLVVKGCGNNNNNSSNHMNLAEHTINNNNNNVNNNYDNGNDDEAAETKNVLVKTVLGEFDNFPLL